MKLFAAFIRQPTFTCMIFDILLLKVLEFVFWNWCSNNYSKLFKDQRQTFFIMFRVVKHHIESRIIRSYIRLRTGLTVFLQYRKCRAPRNEFNMGRCEVIMQGNLFQRCAHLLYCSVLSLGGNVNTRRKSSLTWNPSFT